MGSANAKARINSAIQQSIDITNKSVLTCKSDSLAQNIVNISQTSACGSNVQNVTGNTFDNSQTLAFTTSCYQTATSDASIGQGLSATMKNASDSVAQQAQLSSSNSEAVTNLFQQLQTSISNSYAVDCSPTSKNSNGVNIYQNNGAISCDNPAGGGSTQNVYANLFKQSDYIKNTSDCVQNNKSVTALQQQLNDIIDNSATASVSSMFPGLIFVILFLGIFAMVTYEGTAILTSGGFWSGIFLLLDVLVIIWLIIAKTRQVPWFPYNDC